MQEEQEKSQDTVEESVNKENTQPDLQNGQEPQDAQNEQEVKEPSIEDKLAEAEAKIAELTDSFLRARAETENVRRRAQEDITKAHKFAIENFASSMVAVKDSLETALKVENPTVESFKEGVDMTLKQLNAAFEKNRLVEVMPQKGDKMDPEKHQAISMVEADQEANTVVEVLQKGYMISDRLLRPAMVIVAASKNS